MQYFSREIPIKSECEIVAATVELAGSNNLILCAVYRPPNSTLEYKCYVRTWNICIGLPMWIGGDLNLPNIDWENNVANMAHTPFPFVTYL